MSAREDVLAAARRRAQAHGYGGLNFRELAADVGIKAASIYHHFPGKAELGAAVAKRYWEDAKAHLDAIREETGDPVVSIRRFPATFRTALENDNRMCLCSYMAAELDDLPDIVKVEVQKFAEVETAWIATQLSEAGLVENGQSEKRAHAIFSAVAGAQLVARSRADVRVFDELIESYRSAGLIPA